MQKFESLEEELFYKTLRIRMVEEKIAEIYPSDKIQSPCHLSIGQEAVAVGTCHSLTKEDLIFANYRGHAYMLAKGGDLKEMVAELYGKSTGCGRGKAGSMHLFSEKVGMMVSSAVVASTIPHAVGAAFAMKKQNRKNVAIAIFGDGATEEGIFYESLNFAALKKLPVIFLCENNGLAIHSRLSARQSYQISDLPKGFGMSSVVCEGGYDPLKVHECLSKVVSEIKKDPKPYFVEVMTCRYREHVGPNEDFNSGYRTKEEVEKWKEKDPTCTNKKGIEKFSGFIKKELDEAIAFAESSPWPEPKELLNDVQ